MRRALLRVAIAVASATAPLAAQSIGTPQATELSFGRVPIDRPLEQTIAFENPFGREIAIRAIQLTPPLVATEWTRTIPAGGRGSFTFRLGEPRRPGLYEGGIVVRFTDEAIEPLVFAISGHLVPPVEVVPFGAIFLATDRGTPNEAAVEIVNHREAPLELGAPPAEDARRTLRLETLEPGRRYRLVARMTGNGEAGRRSEAIELATGDPEAPVAVQLNTLLRERVYTFPDEVYFGALPLEQVRDPEIAPRLAQTLMIFRKAKPGFEVRARSTLPYVQVAAERGPSGDRWQLTLSLDPAATPAGEIEGELLLETNDAEFPRLEVPIRGRVLGVR